MSFQTAIFSVIALLAAVRLWRPSTIVDHRTRTCLTAILTLIATPYGYTYDAIPLCIAAGWLFFKEPRIPGAFLVLAWLYPIANHVVNRQGISLGILVPGRRALGHIARVARPAHDKRCSSVARQGLNPSFHDRRISSGFTLATTRARTGFCSCRRAPTPDKYPVAQHKIIDERSRTARQGPHRGSWLTDRRSKRRRAALPAGAGP